MAKPLLDDALWELIEPVLPPYVAKPQGGRPPLDNRRVLTGIVFVLKTGIPWEYLPQELGCGSGMTCWRRLRDWPQAGVWKSVHHILLNQLRAADRVDWSRAVVDSASVRAVGGGAHRSQSDRSGQTGPQTSCNHRGAGGPVGRQRDGGASA